MLRRSHRVVRRMSVVTFTCHRRRRVERLYFYTRSRVPTTGVKKCARPHCMTGKTQKGSTYILRPCSHEIRGLPSECLPVSHGARSGLLRGENALTAPALTKVNARRLHTSDLLECGASTNAAMFATLAETEGHHQNRAAVRSAPVCLCSLHTKARGAPASCVCASTPCSTAPSGQPQAVPSRRMANHKSHSLPPGRAASKAMATAAAGRSTQHSDA